METMKLDFQSALDAEIEQPVEHVHALSELQLALIGGGSGETVFH